MRAQATALAILASGAWPALAGADASAPAPGTDDTSGTADTGVSAQALPGPEAPASRPELRVDDGPFLGDRYRYAEMPILKRVAYDLIAIPANVPGWSASDWAQFGLWTGAGVALSTAGSTSPDVRIDRWFKEQTGRGPIVWTGTMQGALWGGIAVVSLGTWGWAVANDRDDVAQGISLMGEALAVTQFYHVTTKLLLGRSGPTDGGGLGEFGGPVNALHVYPAGTPSGHAGTLYSLLSAGTAYFDPPVWAKVGLHAAVAGVVFFHVVDHRHFASESLWGAAMGWYTGQWVVKHRASYRFDEAPRGPGMEVVPFLAGTGAGLALRGRF